MQFFSQRSKNLKSRSILLEVFSFYQKYNPQPHLFECIFLVKRHLFIAISYHLQKKDSKKVFKQHTYNAYTHITLISKSVNQYKFTIKSQFSRSRVIDLKWKQTRARELYSNPVILHCEQLAMIKTKWNSIKNCLHIVFTMANSQVNFSKHDKQNNYRQWFEMDLCFYSIAAGLCWMAY